MSTATSDFASGGHLPASVHSAQNAPAPDVPSISTVCIHCGGRTADPQTGRCLSCGKVVLSPDLASEFSHPFERRTSQGRPSPSAAYRNGNGHEETAPHVAPPVPPASAGSPPSEADPERELAEYVEQQPTLSFVLPDSRETTSWLAKTKAVRDQLLARAEKAEAQLAELKAEAERCRHTAAAFTSLLGQLSVAGEPELSTQAPPSPRAKPTGKWSRNADRCIDCGRSDVPHCANGRCRSCDGKWRNPRNAP